MADFNSKDFEAPPVYRPQQKNQLDEDDDGYNPDFSFMYKKESDNIGGEVQSSESKLSAALKMKQTLGETARMRAAGLNQADPTISEEHKAIVEADSTLARAGRKTRAEVEEHLGRFEHAPKAQNPLYTTSNNMYGNKVPTPATFTADRASRIQKFSNSFNGMVHRDQGLNTAIIKSRVHSKLDPQFL